MQIKLVKRGGKVVRYVFKGYIEGEKGYKMCEMEFGNQNSS